MRMQEFYQSVKRDFNSHFGSSQNAKHLYFTEPSGGRTAMCRTKSIPGTPTNEMDLLGIVYWDVHSHGSDILFWNRWSSEEHFEDTGVSHIVQKGRAETLTPAPFQYISLGGWMLHGSGL